MVFSFIFLIRFCPGTTRTNDKFNTDDSVDNCINWSSDYSSSTIFYLIILYTVRFSLTSANVNVNSFSSEDVQVDNVYAEISWRRILYKILSIIFNIKIITLILFLILYDYEYGDWIFRNNLNQVTLNSQIIDTYFKNG